MNIVSLANAWTLLHKASSELSAGAGNIPPSPMRLSLDNQCSALQERMYDIEREMVVTRSVGTDTAEKLRIALHYARQNGTELSLDWLLVESALADMEACHVACVGKVAA